MFDPLFKEYNLKEEKKSCFKQHHVTKVQIVGQITI